jgi:hypothetical protein
MFGKQQSHRPCGLHNVCLHTEPEEIQADLTISSSINIAGILLEVSEHSGIWKFNKEIVNKP